MTPAPTYRNVRVLRRRWRLGVLLAVTPTIALVVASLLILAVSREPGAMNVSSGLFVTAVIVGIPFGTLVLWSVHQWKRVRVDVDDMGLSVVNRRETRRIAWGQVRGFELGSSWDPAQGSSPAFVRLRDGSSVTLQAAGSRADSPAFLAAPRAEFEAVLRRTAPPPPAP